MSMDKLANELLTLLREMLAGLEVLFDIEVRQAIRHLRRLPRGGGDKSHPE